MAEELIEYGGRQIGSRPDKYSAKVADAVFDEIKDDLAEALDCTMEDVEKYRADFIRAACSAAHDGYKMASYLERNCTGWDCNGGLVMLFEEAPWDSIYDGFVKQWLDYWKIEPLLNAGTQVKYKFGSNEYISTIEGISQTGLGMYTMAHPRGLPWRHCVRWEDCLPVEGTHLSEASK